MSERERERKRERESECVTESLVFLCLGAVKQQWCNSQVGNLYQSIYPACILTLFCIVLTMIVTESYVVIFQPSYLQLRCQLW